MSAPLSRDIRAILELARWAPSGDNTQPWRFQVVDDHHLVIHGFDTRDHVVYDLDGHPSQMAVGALLETLAIAATTRGRRATWKRRPDTPDTHLLIDVQLDPAQGQPPHPLASCIEKRVVQRRPLSTRPLSPQARQILEASLGAEHQVVWFQSLGQRAQLARFMFDNAKIRLNMPEAFPVHRDVIEWNARFSQDRIPDEAVGVDLLTRKLMRWAMGSWERIDFLNRYLMGDLAPRLQLDLLPGLLCGAHVALLARTPPQSVDDYIEAGRAMQRFWLTACQQGLLPQPEMTPVIFTRYVRRGQVFTQTVNVADMAARLNERFGQLLPDHDRDQVVFMGRLGYGTTPISRSLRKPLEDLLTD